MPRLRRPGCRAPRRYFDQANPLVLHATHASYWLIFSLLGSRTNCIPAKAIAEGLQSQSVKEVKLKMRRDTRRIASKAVPSLRTALSAFNSYDEEGWYARYFYIFNTPARCCSRRF